MINLRRMKGLLDLGATWSLWTQDQWIGNPAPEPIDPFFLCWYSMKTRYVIWSKPTLLTINNIINYFVCVGCRGIYQGSATVFSVLVFLKCIKKKHFRSNWAEQFYLVLVYPLSYSSRFRVQETAILGARMIFQAFCSKIMFYFFLLNSIADKDSRFNSGVQFHLMVPVSFPFRIQICGTVFFFYQGFLSQSLEIHRTAGEGRGPSFISLYHFHPPTNTQTFNCNFPREMTITIF